MNIISVRYVLGAVILVTHFSAIAIFFYLGLSRLDSLEQNVGVILSIAPLTSLYFTAFLRYVVTDDGERDAKIEIPKRSFIIQLIVVCLFCAALIFGGSYLYTSGQIDFQNIGVFTGLVETLFASYLAVIFNSLFPETMTKPNSAADVTTGTP